MSSMSRGPVRTGSSICADCSAADATWASVNRGVLTCEECCSIHRSLGRHVSQVKSLRKGSWSSTQLSMVHQLVSLGANNIWEYSLLDPSQKHGRRKPNPRDPVHPTKADFIRAKYQFLAFVNKQKDSEVSSVEEYSKQLHSSVRTANLETSLRLLSLGADPNFFHPEKGNSALHVAAQAGQSLQVELLVLYGADAGAFDSNGKTPVDHAKMEGHIDLADRLVECQYELTDRLAYFLCGRKPDHRAGQHFIIPEMADSSLDLSELAKAAKRKLQALPNHLFEELAMDVYDEVDRRENNAIWLASQTDTTLVSDRQSVPFLPVNPEYSATRNQGRQKLARFNAREFATLIIDILSDARRRQHGGATGATTPGKDRVCVSTERLGTRSMAKTSSLSDDEPLYDSVASDEDYASIGDNQSLKEEKASITQKSMDTISLSASSVTQVSRHYHKRNTSPTSMISFTESMASSDQSDGPITLEEYMEVKRALSESQARVQQLMQTNKDLKQEITLLQNMVEKLVQENQTFRTAGPPDTAATSTASELLTEIATRARRNDARPQSMFEPRDHQKHFLQKIASAAAGNPPALREEIKPPSPNKSAATENNTTSQLQPETHHGANSSESDYDNANDQRGNDSSSTRSSGRSEGSQGVPTEGSTSTLNEAGATARGPPGGDGEKSPTQEDVVKKTEKITKKIQELLLSAQGGKSECYAVCADKIHVAVKDMAAIFPQNIKDEKLVGALQMLTNGALRLREQCDTAPPDTSDPRLRTQQVIQCAYDIAKAAKQLVILFE